MADSEIRTARLIEVRGTLYALGAIHVGGADALGASDMPFQRDGAGRFVVPGTSLAGVLRDWCRRATGDEQLTDRLWGAQVQDTGQASAVTVADAPVRDPATVAEIRDHVAIDRARGTAVHQRKFDRSVLAAGTQFAFGLTARLCDPDDADALATLVALLDALENGDLAFGGSVSRGLGRVQLRETAIHDHRPGTREGMLAYLQARLAERSDQPPQGLSLDAFRRALADKTPTVNPTSPAGVSIAVGWRPQGAVLVKSAQERATIDTWPLTAAIGGDQETLVLPGSSLKGVLRSHAERILRTAMADTSVDDAVRPPDFDDQLDLRLTPLQLIPYLFGIPASRTGADGAPAQPHDGTGPNHSGRPEPGRAALVVHDCYADDRVPHGTWTELANWTEQDWRTYVAGDPPRTRERWPASDLRPTMHVGIDRWTGGAAESLLYGMLEPHETPWQPIEMDLHLDRLPEHLHLAAFALLLLTLDDLAAGRVPIGHGANRGLGAIAVQRLDLQGSQAERGQGGNTVAEGGLAELAWSLDLDGEPADADAPLIHKLDRSSRERLAAAWTSYLRDPSDARGRERPA